MLEQKHTKVKNPVLVDKQAGLKHIDLEFGYKKRTNELFGLATSTTKNDEQRSYAASCLSRDLNAFSNKNNQSYVNPYIDERFREMRR